MAKNNTDLNSLPNLGKKLVEKLKMVGIETPEDLKNMGSENAFIKLSTIDSDACLNMLYALEGAIQGIRWYALSESKKSELKVFYNMTTR